MRDYNAFFCFMDSISEILHWIMNRVNIIVFIEVATVLFFADCQNINLIITMKGAINFTVHKMLNMTS